MMVLAYQSMNKEFNPSSADIETYSQVLDQNNDGKITYEDIEALAIKYLAGNYDQLSTRANLSKAKQLFSECENS